MGGGACKPCEGMPRSLGRVAYTEQSEAGVENSMSGERSEWKWNGVVLNGNSGVVSKGTTW